MARPPPSWRSVVSASRPPGREVAKVDEVLEAELVSDIEWAALTTQRELSAARQRAYRRDVVVIASTVRTVVTHQRTLVAGRAMLRNATYVMVGGVVLGKRMHEARTNARYERMMRAAEAVGDWDRLEKWEALGEKARDRRHRHVMQRIAAPVELAKGLAISSVALTAVLLALGFLLFAGSGDSADVLGPIRALIALVTWVAWAVAISWGPLVLALPWLVVLALWHVGRRSGATPAWLAPTATRTDGEEITPSVVVTAFRDLGIPELRKRITAMGDAGAGMLSPIRIAGCGSEVDVSLPRGATASSKVLALHERLAENLGRRPYEVHLSLPSAGTVRVWAADSGALDEPIGLSPMILDATLTSSYERGSAPWGQSLRGDPLTMSLYQRHLLITGNSNQGKALATDTPIPTPGDWTTMGALQVGDQVFGADGSVCNVTGAFDVMNDHECYELVFSDGTSIVADAEHLWYTETAASRAAESQHRRRRRDNPDGTLRPHGNDQTWKHALPSVKTTAQIAATARYVSSGRNTPNHSIPVAGALQLAEADLPLDPYILGYWLGDGASAGASISCGDEDVEPLTRELESAGLYCRANRDRTCWRLTFSTHPLDKIPGRSGRSATNVLRQLGLLHNKHIPGIYLRASERQRAALLAGLLDSDGTINPKEGMVEFGICRQQLDEGFVELVQSLGFKIRRTAKRVKGRAEASSTCYKTTFRPRRQVFRLKRKADKVWIGRTDFKSGRRYITDVRRVPSVPVRCIAVDSPDHLFLASRAFIPTHNTRAMLSLALWLAQDPSVEFRIADLKGMNDKTGRSDWSPMDRPEISTKFISGPTDDHVIAATEMLEGAVTEMQRRLVAGGPWTPLIVICDEAQQAFMCPEVGPDGRPYGGKKATSRYFMAARKIHNQGRVVDVLLWTGTQDPTDQNLPELVRNGAHIRASLAVGTAAKSAMALGEKAVQAGAAPHLLRPGLDKGTLVVAGDGAPLEAGQASVTVRTHYIDDEAAQELADRAVARRAPRQAVNLDEPRDLLADVAQALGDDEMVRAKDVAVRLRKLVPGHPDYAHLDGQQLTDLLGVRGVEVRRKDGYPMVRTNRVQRAIEDREENE